MGAATWPCASSTKSICCTSESPALTRPSSGSTLIAMARSEEHTSELQSQSNLVCRLLLEKKKNNSHYMSPTYAPKLLVPGVVEVVPLTRYELDLLLPHLNHAYREAHWSGSRERACDRLSN